MATTQEMSPEVRLIVSEVLAVISKSLATLSEDLAESALQEGAHPASICLESGGRTPTSVELEASKPRNKSEGTRKKRKPTDTDQVYATIKRARGPVPRDVLGKRTGITRQKLDNIIYRLKKAGKVLSPKRGTYVART